MDDFSKEARQEYHKQKCEELRKIRIKMAETLGIPEAVRKEPCNFDGVCRGTCPACYMEEKALMDRIYELSQNGMMDMIFGDVAKEIHDNAFIFDTNNVLFGDLAPLDLDGEIMYDADESECDNIFDKDKPVIKPSKPEGISDIPMTGLVVPPKETEKEQIKKQKSPIKIPDFLKGKKR